MKVLHSWIMIIFLVNGTNGLLGNGGEAKVKDHRPYADRRIVAAAHYSIICMLTCGFCCVGRPDLKSVAQPKDSSFQSYQVRILSCKID